MKKAIEVIMQLLVLVFLFGSILYFTWPVVVKYFNLPFGKLGYFESLMITLFVRTAKATFTGGIDDKKKKDKKEEVVK